MNERNDRREREPQIPAEETNSSKYRNSDFSLDLETALGPNVRLRRVSELDRRMREWMAESARSQILVD